MANEYVNKVIFGGETLIDLTGDDVTASDVLYGVKFHLPTGATGAGSCTFDSDTTDATATAAEILSTKTAYVNKNKVTGSMPNRGAVTGTISTVDGQYTIQNGYHDGSGKVSIDSAEQLKIVPTNIRAGIVVLGVTGTMSGSEDVSAQTKTVTPSTSDQTITPDTPTYNYLSQVTVYAIPVTRTDNAQGGVTVSIAAA